MGKLRAFHVYCIFVVIFCCVGSSISTVVTEKDGTLNVTTVQPLSLKQVEKRLVKLADNVTKMLLPFFVRNSDLKLSAQCMSSVIKLFLDVRKLKVPVLKLLDAMTKPSPGILTGSFSMMGNFDECLEVSVNKKGDPPKSPADEFYHGQYCTIRVGLPQALMEGVMEYGAGKKNLTDFGQLAGFVQSLPATRFAEGFYQYRAGLCIPSTCNITDLEEFIKVATTAFFPLSYFPVDVERCESKEETVLSPDQIAVLIIFGIIAFLVLSGTCFEGIMYLMYDSYAKEEKSKLSQFLLAFSAYNNTKKFLVPSRDPSSEISCINGMYVLGTFLVVIYHTYLLPFFVLFSRQVENLGYFLKDPTFTLISTMGVSIEAYFLFSGLFLIYGRFKYSGTDVRVNLPKLIIRRYIRLCPSMLVIIGVILVLPLIGSGPVWKDIVGVAGDNIRGWWWTYPLMYNNFLAIKDISFLYLWFIPCLFQITIPCAILAWILSKSRKLGILMIILTGIACNVTLGVLTAKRGYPPSYAIYFFYKREQFENPIYTGPLSHVSSFCSGMLLGYYMSQTPKLKWSKIHVVVGWVIACALTVGTQYILYAWHDSAELYPVASAIYAAVHKSMFSLGLSWIILACTYGYGGALGKFFCWKPFGPLSKLVYSGYLVHYLVIAYHVSNARTALTFSHLEIWFRIFAYSVLTFLLAFVLYIIFELPLNYMESLVLMPRKTIRNETGRSTISPQDIVRFSTVEAPDEKNHVFNGVYVPPGKVVLCDEQSKL